MADKGSSRDILIAINIECKRAQEVTDLKAQFDALAASAERAGVAMDTALKGSAAPGKAPRAIPEAYTGGGGAPVAGMPGYQPLVLPAGKYTAVNRPIASMSQPLTAKMVPFPPGIERADILGGVDEAIEKLQNKAISAARSNLISTTEEGKGLTGNIAQQEIIAKRLKAENTLNAIIEQRQSLLATEAAKLEINTEKVLARNIAEKNNLDAVAAQELARREGNLARTGINTQFTQGELGLMEAEAKYRDKEARQLQEINVLRENGVADKQAENKITKDNINETARVNYLKNNTIAADIKASNSIESKTLALEAQTRAIQGNLKLEVERNRAEAEFNREKRKQEKQYLKDNPQDAPYLERLTPFTTVARRLILWTSATMIMIKTTQALGQAFNATKQLEDAMAELKKVMPQGTDFDYMRKGLFEIAKAYGVTAQEAIKAGIIWAQQGFSAKDTLELTKNALLGMNSANLTATQSTNVLTSAYHTFGVTARGTKQVLDGLMRVQADYAVTAQDLADAIQKIGPAIADMGGDINLLNGMIAAVVTQTRKTGTAAATSIKTIVSRFVEPNTIMAFEKIGIAVKKNADEYRALGDILDDLGAKWKSLPEGTRIDLAKQVGGIRQFVDFLALMDRYDIVQEASTKSAQAWGDAQRANDIQIATMSRRLSQLGTTATQLATSTFSDSMWGGIKLIVRGLTGLLEVLNKIPGKGILAVASAIGVLRFVFKKLHFDIAGNITALRGWYATQQVAAKSTNMFAVSLNILSGKLKAVGGALISTFAWIGIVMAVTTVVEKIWEAVDAQKELNKQYKELHTISEDTKEILSNFQLSSKSPVGNVSGADMQKALVSVALKMQEATGSAQDLKTILGSTKVGRGSLLDIYPIDQSIEAFYKLQDAVDKAMEAEKDSFKPLLSRIGQTRDAVNELFSVLKDKGKINFDQLTENTQKALGAERLHVISEELGKIWSTSSTIKEAYKRGQALRDEYSRLLKVQELFENLGKQPFNEEDIGLIKETFRSFLAPENKISLGIDLSNFPEAEANINAVQNAISSVTRELGIPYEFKVSLDKNKIMQIELMRNEIKNFYTTDITKAIAQLNALNEAQNLTWGPQSGLTGFSKNREVLDQYLSVVKKVEEKGLELGVSLREVNAEIATVNQGLSAAKYEQNIPTADSNKQLQALEEKRAQIQKEIADLSAVKNTSEYRIALSRIRLLTEEVNRIPLLINSYELLIDTLKNTADAQNKLQEANTSATTKELETQSAARTKYLTAYYEDNVNMQEAIKRMTLAINIDTEKQSAAIRKKGINDKRDSDIALANQKAQLDLQSIAAEKKAIDERNLAIAKRGQALVSELENINRAADAELAVVDIQTNSANVQAKVNTQFDVSIDRLKNMRDKAEDLRGILRDTVGDLSNISDMITNSSKNNFFKKLGSNTANKMFEQNANVLFKAIIPDSFGKLFMDEQKSMPTLVADATRAGAYEGIVDGLNTHFGATTVDMGTTGITPESVSRMGESFALGLNNVGGNGISRVGPGLSMLNTNILSMAKEQKTDSKKGLSKNDRLIMALSAMGGDIAGSLIANSKNLENNYASTGAGLGSMLGLINPALGIIGGLGGGIIGGLFGQKRKTEEILREIADNTSVLKDMPQGLFNIPANFTLPPAAYGGSGLGNTLQGDINIVINPGTANAGDIANTVKREIESYFNVGSRVGSKVSF